MWRVCCGGGEAGEAGEKRKFASKLDSFKVRMKDRVLE
jgi:hypothetical protein